MPIKEYRCEKCGGVLERIVRLMDEPPLCPKCQVQTTLIISTPARAQWNCSRSTL